MNPIREAAKNLPGHWHRGSMYSSDRTRACGLGHLAGAINKDTGNLSTGNYFHMADIMGEVAREQFPERVNDSNTCWFASFNDHPETTEAEVVAVMEKAAVKWDERS